MGGCASVPKNMRDDAAVAQPPAEQPGEETPAADVQEEGKAVEENDQRQSLGALLLEDEVLTKKEVEQIKSEVLHAPESAEEKATDTTSQVDVGGL